MFKNLFTALNDWLDKKNLIRLDDVSFLRRESAEGWEYIEGDHRMSIMLTLGYRKSPPILYKRAFESWQPPYKNEPIEEQKEEEIFQKVTKHFKKIGAPFIVDETSRIDGAGG